MVLGPGNNTKSPSNFLTLKSSPRKDNPFVTLDLRYADMLVDLAILRGFEGWLLNFELELGMDSGQTNGEGEKQFEWKEEHSTAIRAWSNYLTSEMTRRIPNAAGGVIW